MAQLKAISPCSSTNLALHPPKRGTLLFAFEFLSFNWLFFCCSLKFICIFQSHFSLTIDYLRSGFCLLCVHFRGTEKKKTYKSCLQMISDILGSICFEACFCELYEKLFLLMLTQKSFFSPTQERFLLFRFNFLSFNSFLLFVFHSNLFACFNRIFLWAFII